MSLRTRHPRHCEHHSIHAGRCLECRRPVDTPSWLLPRIEARRG